MVLYKGCNLNWLSPTVQVIQWASENTSENMLAKLLIAGF